MIHKDIIFVPFAGSFLTLCWVLRVTFTCFTCLGVWALLYSWLYDPSVPKTHKYFWVLFIFRKIKFYAQCIFSSSCLNWISMAVRKDFMWLYAAALFAGCLFCIYDLLVKNHKCFWVFEYISYFLPYAYGFLFLILFWVYRNPSGICHAWLELTIQLSKFFKVLLRNFRRNSEIL